MNSRKPMRSFWTAAHLYLGLSVGLVFTLSGLTGSFLVFYVEIDRLINPELVISANHQPMQSYENIVEKLKSTYPARNKSWRLEVPTQPDKPVMARYYEPQEKQHNKFAPLIVAINPYTLEVINHRFWGEYAATWIYDLHYTLLLGKVGSTVIAVIGIFCLLSLFSGLYLWWPKQSKWRQSLILRWRKGYLQKLYDVHTLLGIYTLLLLLAIIVTGLVLAVPNWFTPSINRVSPIFKKPHVSSTLLYSAKRISLDSALNVAQKQFPNAMPRWLETPNDDLGTYLIRVKDTNDIANRFPQTYVWVDQYSGKVLAVRDTKHNTGGDLVMDWQHPLHSGEAFGMLGRLIVFFTGIIPSILLITGYLRWNRKI